ncbi:MAG: hypothetical protein ACRCV6_08155 [Formosimonas sp.]
MKTKLALMVVTGALFGCASGSVAPVAAAPKCTASAPVPAFAALDVDKNKWLTDNELGNSFSQELYANLRCSTVKSRFDADGNGYSEAEYQAWTLQVAPLACGASESLRQQLVKEQVLCGQGSHTKVFR